MLLVSESWLARTEGLEDLGSNVGEPGNPTHVISKQLQTQKVRPWQTDFLANSDALHHLHHAACCIQNENLKTDPKRHQTCLWHDGNAMALS